jgi:hypothetical protein
MCFLHIGGWSRLWCGWGARLAGMGALLGGFGWSEDSHNGDSTGKEEAKQDGIETNRSLRVTNDNDGYFFNSIKLDFGGKLIEVLHKFKQIHGFHR